MITLGGAILALFAIWTEIQLAFMNKKNTISRLVLLSGQAALFIIAVAFSINVIPSGASTSVRVVVLVLGLQALSLTIESHPAAISRTTRWGILCGGHGAVLAGSVLALPFEPTNFTGALLLYAVGVPTLFLHAFWIRAYRSTAGRTPQTDAKRWEAMLLIAIIFGVPSTLLVSLTAPEAALFSNDRVASVGIAVSGVAAILGLGTLGAPQTSPSIIRLLEHHLVAVVLHTLVTLILVNTIVFAVFLIVPQLFVWILGGLLLLLLIGVGINYLMIVHEHRSSDRSHNGAKGKSPEGPLSAVTVVITGFNESAVLPETLPHNIAVLGEMPFVLVPAMRSTDGTIEIMQEMQEAHPKRIRVIEGTTGSKAGDLNRAWQHIETPYVLVLDADETVDSEFVRYGLTRLENDPSIGIVQGRKVAASPTSDAFRRFVTIERQHSTLLDHPLVDDLFDAGHFAGSSAMFRHEVPGSVSGWDPSFLTEDIELTLRLYLQTEWEIVYDTQMISREINPRSWDSLFRQRERWARGWAQVAIQHGGDVLRSWQRIGGRKAGGLSWLLFTAVSAPIFTILPALSLHWYLGLAPQTSPTVAFIIAMILLPERAISFVYTAIRDPVIETTIGRTVEALLFAYTWILFAWIIQLHSLYLQLSGTEGVWHRTTKGNVDLDRIRDPQ